MSFYVKDVKIFLYLGWFLKFALPLVKVENKKSVDFIMKDFLFDKFTHVIIRHAFAYLLV